MQTGRPAFILDVSVPLRFVCMPSLIITSGRINHTVDSATAIRLLVPIYDPTIFPEDLDSGDLALVLLLLTIGTFLDDEPSQSILSSEDYYSLSRAVLYTGIDAAEGPELRIAQCLVRLRSCRNEVSTHAPDQFLRAWYLLMISDRKHASKEAHSFMSWLTASIQSVRQADF